MAKPKDEGQPRQQSTELAELIAPLLEAKPALARMEALEQVTTSARSSPHRSASGA